MAEDIMPKGEKLAGQSGRPPFAKKKRKHKSEVQILDPIPAKKSGEQDQHILSDDSIDDYISDAETLTASSGESDPEVGTYFYDNPSVLKLPEERRGQTVDPKTLLFSKEPAEPIPSRSLLRRSDPGPNTLGRSLPPSSHVSSTDTYTPTSTSSLRNMRIQANVGDKSEEFIPCTGEMEILKNIAPRCPVRSLLCSPPGRSPSRVPAPSRSPSHVPAPSRSPSRVPAPSRSPPCVILPSRSPSDEIPPSRSSPGDIPPSVIPSSRCPPGVIPPNRFYQGDSTPSRNPASRTPPAVSAPPSRLRFFRQPFSTPSFSTPSSPACYPTLYNLLDPPSILREPSFRPPLGPSSRPLYLPASFYPNVRWPFSQRLPLIPRTPSPSPLVNPRLHPWGRKKEADDRQAKRVLSEEAIPSTSGLQKPSTKQVRNPQTQRPSPQILPHLLKRSDEYKVPVRSLLETIIEEQCGPHEQNSGILKKADQKKKDGPYKNRPS